MFQRRHRPESLLGMAEIDYASLALLVVVVAACFLLSMAVATCGLQYYSTSRPAHTYCATCLYGDAR